MYLEYWGLKKHAFNNTPDPGMYFPMHATVENAVAELVFAIEEGDECLAVVVGEVGLGKTMSLRVTLDSINQDKYRIAFVTNPDLTFPQLLREIIGQLTTETCTIKSKDALLERFNQLLFETVDEGKRVVIFIDEGNAIRRLNLQSLRLLTNMQEDDRNLFTMIIAGQPELGKNLERPEMANLFQRIGVYCKLKKMESEEVVKDYIEHRLERAGR
ncbi:MAG: AAA family ATPase, partial [Ignavibacteria bacterium]|nr:AAA family ATPase [Ignavibacteria bacterium]